MFYAELKRGFSKLSFKIALIIGIVFVVVNIIKIIHMETTSLEIPVDDVYIYTHAYIISSYDMFMLFKMSGEGNIFIIMLPLLSAIVYSDSYIEDSKGRISNFIYTRERKEKYIVCKYAVNFILGGIVIIIPLLIHMIICCMLYPTTQMDPMLGGMDIRDGFLPQFFYWNSTIYALLRIFICFIFAGAYSSIALAASVFIKNKFAVVLIPFTIGFLGMLFTEIIGKKTYSHVGILYQDGASIGIVSVHFLIILVSSFLIFYYGVKKCEI